MLRGDRVLALKKSGEARRLSDAIAEVDSEAGRRRVHDYLRRRPFPHFQPADQPGLVARVAEDGTRTTGRFVNREFVASE